MVRARNSFATHVGVLCSAVAEQTTMNSIETMMFYLALTGLGLIATAFLWG